MPSLLVAFAPFAVGFVAGMAASIPIAGPVSVLILGNALQGKRRDALSIAIGSAFGESLYAAAAFVGLSTLAARFPLVVHVSRVLSAIMLLVVGGYLAHKHVQTDDAHKRTKGAHTGLLGFSMTVLNPTLVLLWATVVTLLHGNGLLPTHAVDAAPFAVGVGTGIVTWFLSFIAATSHFRNHVGAKNIARVVHGMGWALVAMGLFMTAKAVLTLVRT